MYMYQKYHSHYYHFHEYWNNDEFIEMQNAGVYILQGEFFSKITPYSPRYANFFLFVKFGEGFQQKNKGGCWVTNDSMKVHVSNYD